MSDRKRGHKRGFLSWAKSHDTLFTFIGATLVLVTFSPKTRSEINKDIVASIQEARNAMVIRHALSELAHWS